MTKIFVLERKGEGMSDIWDTQDKVFFMGLYWYRINGKMTLPLTMGTRTMTAWEDLLDGTRQLLKAHGCKYKEYVDLEFAAANGVKVETVKNKVLPLAQ